MVQTTQPTDVPHKIYLTDYQPPNFSVSRVYLDIKLFDDYATVDSVITMHRCSAGHLVLFGRDLQLVAITVNGTTLTDSDYQLDKEQLVVMSVNGTPIDTLSNELEVCTSVTIIPQQNTSLEGLYIAGDGEQYEIDTMFVTQCEPEGFRKITYFPDRPDVLAEYTTRLEADKKFPTLLANGDLIEEGVVASSDKVGRERHFKIWHDKSKKPSYLFACVFADLAVLQDRFSTAEGREVLLQIYTQSKNIDKCHLAMKSLKDSMRWDEDNYGRSYDLDRYMIVAVSQFNMGAMENKGLNIFNTACVLSSPDTTTDARSFSVKAIIAHEYFHNWTGNRITCRDWFQLCLKEGFTVYRDQSFSASQQSPAVQRIEDVGLLRAHQFAEDAGSLAHPVRPESFVEINNFYTATVYEKGAEIVRMIANMLGKDKFRQGTDEYFRRYDGQAVTVEDFLSALSVSDERVLEFIKWYRQPATPTVRVESAYSSADNKLSLTLSQHTRHVSGYDAPVALPIPVSTAIFDAESGTLLAEKMLMLTKDKQVFEFENLACKTRPILSLLRDFSAPVNLQVEDTAEDLAFLLEHETNGFNRWQATQSLVNHALKNDSYLSVYLHSVRTAVKKLVVDDPMLASRLLDIPSEREMATLYNHNYDPQQVKQQRDRLKQQLAEHMKADLTAIYQQLPPVNAENNVVEDSATARGQRALRNVILSMALTTNLQEAKQWAVTQYQHASCMTERIGALQTIVNHAHPSAEVSLADFYQRFSDEPLVIDLWFSVQAGSDNTSLEQLQALIEHSDFDWGTPNRIRAVMSGLANRPVTLWSEQGLNLYTQVVAKLDDANPVLASRLLQPLARWRTLVSDKQQIANQSLMTLKQQVSSKNVLETLNSIVKEVSI